MCGCSNVGASGFKCGDEGASRDCAGGLQYEVMYVRLCGDACEVV